MHDAALFGAHVLARSVALHGCTWINVVPTIVAYLLNATKPRTTAISSALKFCRSASAALPADHHRAFEARFGIGIIETMGMTETAAPVFSNPYETDRRRVGSIGLPSGGEAKIVDLDGRECAANETGELVLRGEQRDERLLQARRKRRATPSRRTAGCAPATSAIATRTASSSSPAASRN